MGPIFAGLDWRPSNCLGLLLVALELLGICGLLQSSAASLPFSVRVLSESAG